MSWSPNLHCRVRGLYKNRIGWRHGVVELETVGYNEGSTARLPGLFDEGFQNCSAGQLLELLTALANASDGTIQGLWSEPLAHEYARHLFSPLRGRLDTQGATHYAVRLKIGLC